MLFVFVTVPAFLLVACSGSSENTGTTQSALTGPVEMRAVNNDSMIASSLPPVVPQVAGLAKIVVTVARVDAKVDVDTVGRAHEDDDSWVTVATGPFTLDLLSLEGGSFATLGVAELPAGDVDSLRLVLRDDRLSNYVVTSAGVTLPLVVPSDEQAGIRVLGDFDAQACATGHVTLELAGRHSIEIHPDGDGDAYVLRPVIHLREVTMTGACADTDRPTQPPSKEPHGEGVES
jgi:hypothetical protein